MKPSHWSLLGAALVGLSGQIAGLHDWHAVLTPSFISGTLVALGSTIGMMFAPAVKPSPDAVPVPRP
jgi:hypothetical protein